MASGDDYVLTRDVGASARLNLSHYIWLNAFGFNLHPTIRAAIEGQSTTCIADAGTGIGIWLLDLARELPKTAQLHGLEISFGQCPPKAWLPSNVSLTINDIFADAPDELKEVYDVIHIRHFVCVVKGDDPSRLLQNLLSMLKPGGWIQWNEWDVDQRDLVKAADDSPHVYIDALEQEFKVMRKHTPLPTWPPHLEHIMEAAGMRHALLEKRISGLSHLPFMHDLTMLVSKELIDNAEASKALDVERVNELRTLLNGAIEESRKGAAWNLARCMAIAQKPARASAVA